MTPTAIDTQDFAHRTAFPRQADRDTFHVVESLTGETVSACVQALTTAQRLHKLSSKIRFAELQTAELPTPDEIIDAVSDRLSGGLRRLAQQEASEWDVEGELPVWEGAPALRAVGVVRTIRKPKFRAITEDEIGNP